MGTEGSRAPPPLPYPGALSRAQPRPHGRLSLRPPFSSSPFHLMSPLRGPGSRPLPLQGPGGTARSIPDPQLPPPPARAPPRGCRQAGGAFRTARAYSVASCFLPFFLSSRASPVSSKERFCSLPPTPEPPSRVGVPQPVPRGAAQPWSALGRRAPPLINGWSSHY